MKISLVIPNYKNLDYLKSLLKQVEKIGFYKIFVLDDNSPKEVTNFLENIKFIELKKSTRRLLPTANRNRILGENVGDWILFLDSDMEIISKNLLKNISEKIAQSKSVKVIGGLILSDTNEPMWFNYGKFLSPLENSELGAWVNVGVHLWNDKEEMKWVKEQAGAYNYNYWEPTEKQVDWVAEGFFAIDAKFFNKLGGFDEKFKMFHEGPDLCKRTWEDGFEVLFTPDIKVKHLGTDNIGDEKRKKYMLESTAYWYKKHYGIPKKIYKKLVEIP